jgi:hypothetical protein
MIIPNIWKNKIHVPNHQPEIYIVYIIYIYHQSVCLQIYGLDTSVLGHPLQKEVMPQFVQKQEDTSVKKQITTYKGVHSCYWLTQTF